MTNPTYNISPNPERIDGYAGRVMRVDLTEGVINSEGLDVDSLSEYLQIQGTPFSLVRDAMMENNIGSAAEAASGAGTSDAPAPAAGLPGIAHSQATDGSGQGKQW